MIRYDPELKGIPIPDKNGDMISSKPTELRERAFADDTGVGIQDDDQLPRLGLILKQYCEASGALVNYDKCVGIRLGQARDTTPPMNEVITPKKWYRMGIDKTQTQGQIPWYQTWHTRRHQRKLDPTARESRNRVCTSYGQIRPGSHKGPTLVDKGSLCC